jgi:hypothetical protein
VSPPTALRLDPVPTTKSAADQQTKSNKALPEPAAECELEADLPTSGAVLSSSMVEEDSSSSSSSSDSRRESSSSSSSSSSDSRRESSGSRRPVRLSKALSWASAAQALLSASYGHHSSTPMPISNRSASDGAHNPQRIIQAVHEGFISQRSTPASNNPYSPQRSTPAASEAHASQPSSKGTHSAPEALRGVSSIRGRSVGQFEEEDLELPPLPPFLPPPEPQWNEGAEIGEEESSSSSSSSSSRNRNSSDASSYDTSSTSSGRSSINASRSQGVDMSGSGISGASASPASSSRWTISNAGMPLVLPPLRGCRIVLADVQFSL